MMRAQLGLLDYLGIEKLYASVGASMGGMQSLSLAYLAPERVGRVASISATGRSGLGGVGMRYAQRSGTLDYPLIRVMLQPAKCGNFLQFSWQILTGIEAFITTGFPLITA